MINNSSLHKWERLDQKHLDQQFLNTIIHGMNCSPFEANAILDTVHEIYGTFFDMSGSLKPGQTLFQVLAIDNCPSTQIKHAKQVSVILTLDNGPEDLRIRENSGVSGLRIHRMERVCNEAFQQGGVLTVEDLAFRLFNCGPRTICRDIKELKRRNIILPLRSVVQDMGRAITHRSQIITQWLKGNEYSDIANSTFHSVASVRNYVDKFKRTIALANEGYDIHSIGFLVKISSDLATEYYKLWKSCAATQHRKAEMADFIKKNSSLT